MILVSSDSTKGTLRRWEAGGSTPRLTHSWASVVAPCEFTRANIDEFYTNPPDVDRVGNVVSFPGGVAVRQTAFTPALDYDPPCDVG